MDDLGKDVGLDLPKGANDSVDSVGKDIVLKYGLEKLDTIAKLNFKNTDKIKKMLK